MYKLKVGEEFVAQHYLTIPGCGPENEWHSHHFRVSILLKGEHLNEHGYLVDIVDVEDILDELISRYEDATLNDLPEFSGLNPSIEHFSRIFYNAFLDQLSADHLASVTVRIWEDEDTWASYSSNLEESSSRTS